MVKNHLPMQETQVLSLGGEESLEEKLATHSSILAWEMPWTEEGVWQATVVRLQKVQYDWATKHPHILTYQFLEEVIFGLCEFSVDDFLT